MTNDFEVRDAADLHVRALHLRELRAEKREADFIASTDAIDSYGERVEQAWDLQRYKANPVVLWAHQSRELPIGKARDVRVVDGELRATIVFASERANPKAEQVWQSVQEGTLRAVSVGFVPREIRSEKIAGKDVVVLGDNDLFEISVTPIPANPEALAKARARAIAQLNSTNKTNTNLEELIKAKAALDESVKALEVERLKSAALDSQNAVLVKERDAALERAAASDKKLVELEVDGLVGVKFTKEERDAQVELALSNRPLFERMLSQRSDLPAARDLTGAGPVITPEPVSAVAERSTDDDNGLSLEAAIQRKLRA